MTDCDRRLIFQAFRHPHPTILFFPNFTNLPGTPYYPGFGFPLGGFSSESSPYPPKALLAAAVIKFCCSAVSVAGDALCGFKGAVIFQEIGDTGRPE